MNEIEIGREGEHEMRCQCGRKVNPKEGGDYRQGIHREMACLGCGKRLQWDEPDGGVVGEGMRSGLRPCACDRRVLGAETPDPSLATSVLRSLNQGV